MDKTIRIVTYSTIGLVIILPVILFFVGGGWLAVKATLAYIAVVMGVFVLIFLLRKFLSDGWVYSIMTMLFITVLHFFIESWLFDFFTVLLAGVYYVVSVKLDKKVLSYLVMGCFFALLIYATAFDSFHEVPEITASALQETEADMSTNDDVVETFVNNEEDRLYCTMEVDSTVSKGEKKELGQTCAKILSQSIADDQDITGPDSDNLGGVYDDYELIIMILETEDTHKPFLHGQKGTHSDDITWQMAGSGAY